MCLSKKVARKLQIGVKEKDRKRRIEIFTKLHKDQNKINDAARVIQERIGERLRR